MKKYLFILGLVGTALFTACSTSDDLVADKPIETSPDDQASITTLIAEARQDSEVPITLGVNQGRGNTRKPIGGESNDPDYVSFDTETGKYIGVFCLATGYQSSYASNPPIANNWTDNDDTGLLVRMKNVPATVIDGTVAFYNHARTSGQNYYYPMGDWMKYNFYAYYPWQDEEVDGNTLVFKNNRVLEKYYDIDGSQDIIWGKAHPEGAEPVSPAATDADPYSAKYIRLKRKEVGGEAYMVAHYPKLKFEHKLVQFRFFVKAAKATAEETDHTIRDNLRSLDAQVTDMYIANAINRLMVVVADQSSVNNTDGTLYWFGNTLNTKKLGIKTNGADTDRFPGTAIPEDGDTDGHPDWVDAITDYSNPVGYILLAPPTVRGVNNPDVANNHVYQLYLKVQYNNGSGGTETNVVTLSLNPPSGGFIAGKIYNILVNVQSPEQISATAVLQEWDNSPAVVEYGND